MRQLVVIAGGLGSRLSNSGVRCPKILLEVSGVTLLERYVRLAEENSYGQLLLILGHQSDEVRNFLLTKDFPIEIVVTVENQRLGTAGALIQSRKFLHNEFTLILGDLLIENCNLEGSFKFFQHSISDVLCFVKYTDHPEDSDLVDVGLDGRLINLHKYPHKEIPQVATSLAGVAHIRKEVIPIDIPTTKIDFFKETLWELVRNNSRVFCIYHQGLVRDIGTPSRLSDSESYLNDVTSYKKSNSGLLLDRDGTLIQDIPYNIDAQKVQLLSHSKNLIKKSVKFFDYVAVITNQPLVARGDGEISDVIKINSRMNELLGDERLIQDFLVCPHHPDSGFQGELVEFKVKCNCRKPEVNLLLQAGIKGKFFLTNSLYIGDSDIDVYAALRVGASWIHLHIDSAQSLKLCPLNKLHNGECVSSMEVIARMEDWNDYFEDTP